MVAGFNTNFIGWMCSAGHQSITINNDGKVTRGTLCKHEILGNIKTGFNIFKKPKHCITDKNCNCGADLILPKWRDNEYNMPEVG